MTVFLKGGSRSFSDLVVEDDRFTTLLEYEENERKLMLKECLS